MTGYGLALDYQDRYHAADNARRSAPHTCVSARHPPKADGRSQQQREEVYQMTTTTAPPRTRPGAKPTSPTRER